MKSNRLLKPTTIYPIIPMSYLDNVNIVHCIERILE